MWTELQKSRLLGMQLQVELSHSFGEFRPELISIRFALESSHDVVGESHDDHIAVRPLPTPRLDPQVEYVKKYPEESGISRFGEPEEIAELLAYLVSPAAKWMTGASLRMDGGEFKGI
jgi:hypothetical protein